MNITSKPVKGFLLDITGVLYNSDPNTSGRVIQGSVEAVNRFFSFVFKKIEIHQFPSLKII